MVLYWISYSINFNFFGENLIPPSKIWPKYVNNILTPPLTTSQVYIFESYGSLSSEYKKWLFDICKVSSI